MLGIETLSVLTDLVLVPRDEMMMKNQECASFIESIYGLQFHSKFLQQSGF
jgi:hypothetical protein